MDGGSIVNVASVAGALAAVDVQDLAGDEGRALQVEAARRAGLDDIADLAHAAERVQPARAS
jgi:hypothetical protein